jgi:hypothetical protein
MAMVRSYHVRSQSTARVKQGNRRNLSLQICRLHEDVYSHKRLRYVVGNALDACVRKKKGVWITVGLVSLSVTKSLLFCALLLRSSTRVRTHNSRPTERSSLERSSQTKCAGAQALTCKLKGTSLVISSFFPNLSEPTHG